jgi:hypothetical protein
MIRTRSRPIKTAGSLLVLCCKLPVLYGYFKSWFFDLGLLPKEPEPVVIIRL